MQSDGLVEINKRITRLERNRNVNLWLQFLVFPIILAGMGYLFQSTIRDSTEKREQLQMAQGLVEIIFNDTIYDKTIAMRGILYEVLDNEKLSKQLGKIIDNRLKNLILNGPPGEVVKVDVAIRTYSTEADSLKSKFSQSTEIQEKLSKLELTKKMEREAFIYLKNGELQNAEIAFRLVDSIYPEYHQAYEIQRYLRKNREFYDNKVKIPEIQNYTIENFDYGAPKDLLKDIKEQVKTSSGNY